MRTSDSALEQYEECPRQYDLERNQKKRGKPTAPIRLGRVVHRTIQKLLKKYKEAGEAKPFDASLASDIYTEEWGKELGLSGKELFTDGLQIVADWVEKWSIPLDPHSILGIEEPFKFTIEYRPQDDEYDDEEEEEETAIEPSNLMPVEVVGYLDLVLGHDLVDEETGEVETLIEVIDWKTTKAFLTSRDAQESLQLSIYDLAAREKWPDARAYRAALNLLRDGTHLQVRHSTAERRDTERYILATAAQIRDEREWAPRLNSNCTYCHHRHDCPAYQKALKGDSHTVAEDMNDFDKLIEERAALAIRKKIVGKRLDEIDDVIKAHLKSSKHPLEIGGWFFKLSSVERKNYPADVVIPLLAHKFDISPAELLADLTTVSTKKLKELMKTKAEELGREKVSLVQATLESKAERNYSSRLYNRKEKKPKPKK
jgi:CRISPR/Cas system-associated exonuclease Cas4 (RecB family)